MLWDIRDINETAGWFDCSAVDLLCVDFYRSSAVKEIGGRASETECLLTGYSPASPLRDFPADRASMENQTFQLCEASSSVASGYAVLLCSVLVKGRDVQQKQQLNVCIWAALMRFVISNKNMHGGYFPPFIKILYRCKICIREKLGEWETNW